MKVYIYLDDFRPCPAHAIPARSFEEAIILLNEFKNKNIDIYFSFDHDLGEEKTGYDVAKYIVENQIPIAAFYVHSANPVGRQNIIQLLTHYGYTYKGYSY